MTVTESIWFYVFAFLVWGFLRLKKIGSREPGLPPGPPTLPLLGNLHIFPTEYAHYKFTEWARIYGDVYSLKVGPATAIVITSAAAVKELMDKRSASTADRPPHNMADVVTGGSNMVLARYCKKGSLDAGGYSDPDMILLKRTCGECFARMPI